MSEKLLLPRIHLSWSAYSCFRQNPDRFRREYFEKGKKLDTKYLRFGKGIAEMIENGTHKDLLPGLPTYPIHELEIRTIVQGVPLLSYLDGYDDREPYIIGEYKTGKIPWSDSKVQKHEQLTFYAVAVRSKFGVMPHRAELHWIETKDEEDVSSFWGKADKQIAVTGKILTFIREFDVRELDRMEKEIVKTAHDISNAYKAFLAEI